MTAGEPGTQGDVSPLDVTVPDLTNVSIASAICSAFCAGVMEGSLFSNTEVRDDMRDALSRAIQLPAFGLSDGPTPVP